MNIDGIDKIIDKLAEKLGVAATEIGKVAQEVVSQYQMQCIVGAICIAILGIVVVGAAIAAGFLLRRSWRKTGDCDYMCGSVAAFTLGGLLFVVFGSVVAGKIMGAAAPLYYCLKELL